MLNVTYDFVRDSEITMQNLKNLLLKITEYIHLNNKCNLTDINIICEEIFGEILNKLYNIKLVSTSSCMGDYYCVAVDLVDPDNRIAYQITSRIDRSKIKDTIVKLKKNSLIKDVDDFRILQLSMDGKSYTCKEIKKLREDNSLPCKISVMALDGLLSEIQEKSRTIDNLIPDLYNSICMIFDSGRLKYDSIIKEKNDLSRKSSCVAGDMKAWVSGYGDVQLWAYIPLTYNKQLSCMLQFRRHDISGEYITFDQKALLADYFVSESDFKSIHSRGRFGDEEDICFQMGNLRFDINANTADHVYRLFCDLNKEYQEIGKHIDTILGTKGLQREDEKYLLMTIDTADWERILFFAKNHSYDKKYGEMEWNIFHKTPVGFWLQPNLYGQKEGLIYAQIIAEADSDKTKVYWKPGYGFNLGDMKGFDNVTKWKADYTIEWMNELIIKTNEYYKKCNGMSDLWATIVQLFHFKRIMLW